MPSAFVNDDGIQAKQEHILPLKISNKDEGVQKHFYNSDSTDSTEVEITNLADEHLLETDPFYSVSQFESLLFATVLEDATVSMRILNECNTHLRVQRLRNDMNLLLKDKYGVAKPDIPPDELAAVDRNRLGCDEYKLYKLEKDRDDVINALLGTYKGLTLSYSFRPLWNFCRDVTEQQQYGENIKLETSKNKVLARTMNRQLRQQTVQHMAMMNEFDSIQDDLTKQIQDAEQMASIKERYTTKWQNSRIEQLNEDVDLKQGAFTDSIQYYKRRTVQEAVVHNEIEMLVNICIQEKLQQIEDLMTKYETDMEKIDLKIQISMSDLNKVTTKNYELSEKLKSRAKEINAWVKFKEERAKSQKYHNDMTRSAIIVQAWWRGLLVRKQLGPFRPSKKPKPTKKKAKE